MNYARVYQDFIADRITKQPEKPAYFERHHIVPRALGGGDEPTNIVRLTPGDHLFAHLLLAKAYGGKLWGGLWCMVKLHSNPRRAEALRGGVARATFARLRIEHAERTRRAKAGVLYRSKCKTYTIYHIDGRSFTAPLVALHDLTGVNIASLSRLSRRQQGRTYDGWYMFADMAEMSLAASSRNAKKVVVRMAGANRRKVLCVETGVVFESITAASRWAGTAVSNYFKSDRTNAGGYTWQRL